MTLFDKQTSADICFEFPSGELEVRAALCKLKQGLKEMNLAAEDISSVEVVLGEVLNNIVEHAYGEGHEGRIAISVARELQMLRFHVIDEGGALPKGILPEGRLPKIEGSLEAMPEGGFGWYLVRNLAQDLAYSRNKGRNELAFTICCETQS